MTVALGVVAAAFAVATGEAEAQVERLQRVAVFGSDDRTALPPRYSRLQEAIGVLLNARTRTVCTAFCVGEAVIATAGHCLFRTSGDAKPRLADFWFARNYDRVRETARILGHDRGLSEAAVLAGSTALKTTPPIDATRDWALVRLARPVCGRAILEVQAMPVEHLVTEARGGRLFQIAYHRDYQLWQQAYSTPCGLEKTYPSADWSTITSDFSNAEDLLLHTCDTGGASSGSPLFVDTAQGPKVVGINVGTYVQSRSLMRDGKVIERPKSETVANTGVGASVFVERIAALAKAELPATTGELRQLDEELRRRGLLGEGGETRRQRAIEAYERSAGMTVTGIASRTLLKRLQTKVVRP